MLTVRTSLRVACYVAVGMAAALAGCFGEPTPPETASQAQQTRPYAALLDRTWAVQLTQDALRTPFEAPGWVQLFARNRYEQAVKLMGPKGGLATARAHADLAALYRQATLAHANALVQTYGNYAKPTDPVGVAHLLTVAHALLGNRDQALAASAKLGQVSGQLLPWHQPWATWLAASPGPGTWPDLTTLPTGLPEVQPGLAPELAGLPHYRLRENIQGESLVDMGDPAALLQLALWHEAAALQAAPDQSAALLAYGARYRLPAEAPVQPLSGKVPMELLFGSDYAVAGDVAFMAAAVGGQGLAAVDAFKNQSVVAAIAAASLGAQGHLDPEQVLNHVANLRSDLLSAQQQATGGQQQGYQLLFANAIRTGVLRNLSLLAETGAHNQAHRDSGILRIGARDFSVKESASPEGLMSLAAWDSGNAYPLRAAEILHQHIKDYPSLQIARYGLDALALRVSFGSGGGPAN